jgi:hypothetical protein
VFENRELRKIVEVNNRGLKEMTKASFIMHSTIYEYSIIEGD